MRLLLACLAILCLGGSPALAKGPEYFVIEEYRVIIAVVADGQLEVVERIAVRFSQPRHGIYRLIPLEGPGKRLRIELRGVDDGAENPRPYRTTYEGGMLRIRIGSEDRKVAKQQVYRIAYTVRNALLFASLDEDELKWDAIGTQWPVRIDRAEVNVRLADGVDMAQMRHRVFSGKLGSLDSEVASVTRAGQTLTFVRSEPLSPGQGMTVVVGWPAGVVDRPGTVSLLTDQLRDWWPAIPLFGWPLLLTAWWYFRRRGLLARADRAARIADTDGPPEELTPLESGTLIDGRVDPRDVVAAAVDLAARGYMILHDEDDAEIAFSRGPLYAERTELGPPERTLLEGLCVEEDGQTYLADLERKFHEKLDRIRDQVREALADRGLLASAERARSDQWFDGATWIVIVVLTALVVGGPSLEAFGLVAFISVFLIVGGVVLVSQLHGRQMAFVAVWATFFTGIPLVMLGGFLTTKTGGGGMLPLLFPASGLLVVALMFLHERYPCREWITPKAAPLFGQLVRFERTLTERAGLRIDGEPQVLFERYLPHALALGLAESFTQQFGRLMSRDDEQSGWWSAYHPTWYAGHHMSRLGSQLSSLSGQVGDSLSSVPRSSSGFGGGGGFSGGGFGGGGGGSW